MKIGIYSNAFRELPLDEALMRIHEEGVTMVELGCGEESGFAHCNPKELLEDPEKLERFRSLLRKYEIGISALSCHGNPLSPDEEIRKLSVDSMYNAVLLCEKLGLRNINCFSGCPGDSEEATLANWVTVSWPLDYAKVYKWQWETKVIPFWQEFTAFARAHGVDRIALELHPGQVCFNPATVKKLRAACGEEIGVNLDFSHLLWQRMDPILVIRELEGMIYHMHAKDIRMDPWKVRANGLINNDYFDEPEKRSWNFRTVGFGHGEEFWRNIFAELRAGGYDGTVSIEMECDTLAIPDAFPKAVAFLRANLPQDMDPGEMSWQKKTRVNRLARFEKYGLSTD